MALDTVADYITEARRLLQDERPPYRYADANLISALNFAVLDARRLRPDLFLGGFETLPAYALSSDAVALEPMYRRAFVWAIVGSVGLNDAEPAQDQRATYFMTRFTNTLLAVGA